LSYALAAAKGLFPFKEGTVKRLQYTVNKEGRDTNRDKANIH
jgi:hypothetical protein